jgi:tripartite-type tricarboxylate transporter receptor subunit TctC
MYLRVGMTSMYKRKAAKTARRLTIKTIAACAVITWTAGVLAQQKPIRIIVPYAAGGPIDVTARVLAERVSATLGPVIIENKPGAGGNIGADAVAKAAPDGLTIGIAALATHAINPWLYSNHHPNGARAQRAGDEH